MKIFDFGEAIRLLKQGACVARIDWEKEGKFICKQIPATIGREIIPKMQSLPDVAKEIITRTAGVISYENQCLIYNCTTATADSWLPSSEDMFAEDWTEIV